MSALLPCNDLLRATGYQNVGDLVRSLHKQGIRFFYGRGGTVWTTIDLVNAAGGLKQAKGENEQSLDPEGFR